MFYTNNKLILVNLYLYLVKEDNFYTHKYVENCRYYISEESVMFLLFTEKCAIEIKTLHSKEKLSNMANVVEISNKNPK